MVPPPARSAIVRWPLLAAGMTLALVTACGRARPSADERVGVASTDFAHVAAPSASVAPVAAPPGGAPGASASGAPPAGSPGRAAKTHHVLLLLIDSLRWDMPWNGYPKPIAPRLTKLAGESVVYTHAYSVSSYTAQSVPALLAGKYPTELSRDGYFFTTWHPENVFFGERLGARGHRALSGHGHGYFDRKLGLAQGFDDYRLLPGTELDTKGVHDVTSERLVTLAKEMLSDPANTQLPEGKRFFAYFHFLDPHYMYYQHRDGPDFGLSPRGLYDGEVHHTDRWVGELLDWVWKQPFAEDLVVVISADHGEGFREHGRSRHAYELWDELIRVPLIVHFPGVTPRRIEVPRSHLDLAPTFAELMGAPADPDLRGLSLVSELRGGTPAERPVLADLTRNDLMDRRRALVWEGWKLLSFGDDKTIMLFDLEHDPTEQRDLARSRPEKLAELRALYDRLSGEIRRVPATGLGPLLGAPPGQRW
ncbi:MAG: sulfatase [Polyangiaceae bacterium]|nr:sulfatase [Polyangiaceae bacterium]